MSMIGRTAHYLKDARTVIGVAAGVTTGIKMSHLSLQILQHVRSAGIGGAIGAVVGAASGLLISDARIPGDAVFFHGESKTWQEQAYEISLKIAGKGAMIGGGLGAVLGSFFPTGF